MSFQNTRPQKRRRSLLRADRKRFARLASPCRFVVIDRKTVRAHRYLRDHGLPHSKAVAGLHIDRLFK